MRGKRDIHVVAAVLATVVASVGCGGSKLGGASGNAGRGGSVLTGMGGGDVGGTGGDVGGGGDAGGGRGGDTSLGGTGVAGDGRGGIAGGGIAGIGGRGGLTGGGGDASAFFDCMPESPKTVIGCGGLLSASSMALAPGGKAFVSFGTRLYNSIVTWDNTGDWKTIASASSFSYGSVRVDSQGRPVFVTLRRTTTDGTVGVVQRWNGTTWEPQEGALPATAANVSITIDFEIDALDRPVLLLSSSSSLSVHRLEAGTWVQLGNAIPINNVPWYSMRLALDSADGVTPHVAFRPDSTTEETIVLLRLTSGDWSQLPALTRSLDGDFDLAIAGGVPFLAYVDGAANDGRVYLSRGSATGWSAGQPLNGDTNRPAVRTRIAATGPSSENLIVGYEEVDSATKKHQVAFKRGPDWSLLPGSAPPVAGADMRGFEMAVDATRVALIWTTSDPEGWMVLGYHEFPR